MTSLLSNGDMTYVRGQAETLLPDQCDIRQRGLVSDGQGGFSEAFAIAYPNISCRLTEQSGNENTTGGVEGADSGWILTLPYDQSIERDDQVSHGAITYEVVFANSARSYDTVRRVTLRRIN
jgi:hypothetical protein